MASLKEIRGRINSVSATRKITDVNRMISSAKLHKAQSALNAFTLYKRNISSTFYDLVSSMPDADIPLMTANNESKAVLIVAFASNTGLCGAFNSNVIRRTTEIVEQYRAKAYDVRLYTLGKKVYERFAYDNDIRVENLPFDIHEHPTYERLSEIAEQIISLYLDKKVDRVIMIYNRFKNILTQYITEQTLLPDLSLSDLRSVSSIDYIMEPDKKTLIDVLAPQIVKLRFYETLLESLSAEYGARSSAMQAATDNANDLIGELSTLYNKVRQSAITGELIDIVGGSEALK